MIVVTVVPDGVSCVSGVSGLGGLSCDFSMRWCKSPSSAVSAVADCGVGLVALAVLVLPVPRIVVRRLRCRQMFLLLQCIGAGFAS